MKITTDTNNRWLKEALYWEVIPMEKLDALLRSKTVLQEDTDWWDTQHGIFDHWQTPNERNFILNLMKKCKRINNNGKYYLQVHYFSKGDIGRVFPKMSYSLGVMRRPVRHWLCDGLYYDIDIINCHPTLLYYIATLPHNVEAGFSEPVNLKKYLDNREVTLKLAQKFWKIDRETAKILYITLINGGGWKNILMKKGNVPEEEAEKAPQYIKNFKKEVNMIRNLLKATNSEFYALVTKDKNTAWEKDNRFISYYLQAYEEIFLEHIIKTAHEMRILSTNFKEIVLCHDGVMMLKSLFKRHTIDDFINEVNKSIVERFETNRIKVKVKEFDEADTVAGKLDLEGITVDESYTDPFEKIYGIRREDPLKDDDNFLASLFCNKQQHLYQYCNDVIYKLNPDTGLYKAISKKKLCDEYVDYMDGIVKLSEERKSLQLEILEKSLYKAYVIKIKQIEDWIKANVSATLQMPFMDGDDENIEHNYITDLLKMADKMKADINNKQKKKICNQASKVQVVNRCLEIFTNDDFENLLDENMNLLGFDNGVIDVDDDCCFRSAKPDCNEYVNMSCGYNFPDMSNEKIREKMEKDKAEIMSKIRNIFLHEEDMWYMLKALSRCLRGDSNYEEILHFIKGEGSNGKGLLMCLVRMAFGAYYFPLDWSELCAPQADTRNPHLYGAVKKRVIECAEPAADYEFHSDTIKKMTGNDIMLVRTNYQKEDTPFKMGHLFIPLNHFAKFNNDTEGYSMIRRIKGVEFPFVFPKEEDFNPDLTFEYNDKTYKKHKKRDEIFKDKVTKGYYSQAFMLILIDAYRKYKKEGLILTPYFKETTEFFLWNLSNDRGWFDENLVEDEKYNLDAQQVYREWKKDTDRKLGYDKWKTKAKEFLGDCFPSNAVKTYDIKQFKGDDWEEVAEDDGCLGKRTRRALVGYRFSDDKIKELSTSSYGY